jgi:hypothetical protein
LGGGFLILVMGFLIAITIPNLCREVAPPEISGPNLGERNPAQSPASSTSRTLTVSAPTSGTQPLLNLDDFPHLSPTMQKLAQGWMDQCAETDRLIAAISDPAQRALAFTVLTQEREKIDSLLKLPLRWDSQTFEDTNRYLNGWPSYKEVRSRNGGELKKLLDAYPDLKSACRQELIQDKTLWRRMAFEFYVQGSRWDSAFLTCAFADSYTYRDRNGRSFRDCEGMNSWEEEVYCLRQMGAPGWACLTGRSYQRILDSQLQDHLKTNKYLWNLRQAGYYPYAIVYLIQGENASKQDSD